MGCQRSQISSCTLIANAEQNCSRVELVAGVGANHAGSSESELASLKDGYVVTVDVNVANVDEAKHSDTATNAPRNADKLPIVARTQGVEQLVYLVRMTTQQRRSANAMDGSVIFVAARSTRTYLAMSGWARQSII